MAAPVVIYAPAGAGKSQHADVLKRMFGCTSIVDPWDGVTPLPDGSLALTNVKPVTESASTSGDIHAADSTCAA